jgi:hypothetical protein
MDIPKPIPSSATFGFSYLITSIILIIIGVSCYHVFMLSDYVQYANPIAWIPSPGVGYTEAQFACYIIGTILLPLSTIFILLFAFHRFKCSSISNENLIFSDKMLYLILAVVFFYLTSFSYNNLQASSIFQCGVIFCFTMPKAPKSTMNEGAIVFIGITDNYGIAVT